MPSLSDLQKFKSSFHNIGGQKADLVAKNLPFDDLELPDAESESVVPAAETGANGASNGTPPSLPRENGGSPPAPSKAETPPAGAEIDPSTDQADGFDFSTLIGTQLGNPPPPPPIDVDSGDDATIGKKNDSTLQGESAPEEFYTPMELLSNFSEEIDAIAPDFPADESFEEVLLEDDEPIMEEAAESDLDDFFSNLPTEEDGTGLDSKGATLGDDLFGDFVGTDGDDLGLDDLGDFGDTDEPLAADESAGDLDDLELGGPDQDSLDDFDFGSFDTGGDGLDDFNLSDDPLAANEFAGDIEGGDFNLDDLGDFGLSDDPLMANGTESGSLDLDDLGDFGLSDDPLMADSGLGDTESDIFNLDDLGDLGLSDEPLMADGSDTDSFNLDDLGDLGLSDEPLLADGFESDFGDADSGDFDLGDLGLSDEPLMADGSESDFGDTESSDFNLDDLGGLDLSDGPIMADDSESGSFDLGDLGLSDELPMADGSESDFDLGDLGLSDEPLMADGSESDFGDTESSDFNLDDLGGLDLSDGPIMADDSENYFDLGDDLGLLDEPLMADGSDSDFGDTESSDFNLDDLGGLDLSDEPIMADDSESDFDLGDDLGLSDEPLMADGSDSDDFNIDDLGDLNLSDEPLMADESEGNFDLDLSDEPLMADGPASAIDDAEGGDFDLGDLGISDEPIVADGPESDLDDADTGSLNLGDLGFSDEPLMADEPASAIDDTEKTDFDLDSLGDLDFTDGPTDGSEGDGFDLPEDSAFANGSFGTEDDATEDEVLGIDDFSFPDLDKALEKVKTTMVTPTPETPAAPVKAGFPWVKPKPSDIPLVPDSLEDIKISEDEFRDLQDTLSNYPLNLRIACQEIIVEQDIAPAKMMMLIRNLVQGAPAKETASLASEVLGRTITIPKAFEKSSGEALAAEQASFSYIFLNSFLPVFRIVAIIAILAASVFYLSWTFVIRPLYAESIYREGYELIHAGNFRRANERFADAFAINRNRNWFYRYAEAFIYYRQYPLAEQKYEMLLRYFPRDRRGVLDFARLQTNRMHNHHRAEQLLRRNILDFYPDDFDALLAVGDNALAWGEIEPARFEDARIAFARVLETHGWTPPVVERMLRFFIRTDNLREVLHLRNWFDAHPRRTMQASTLAELGGYLLDKQFEEVRGVPNEFRGQIRGVPDILLEAVRLDPNLPEPHYHLSRFYHSLGRNIEERIFLEQAIRAFDNTREESVRRLRYRIDAHRRYADVLINDREFIPAEEQLVRGVNLYEDGIRRRILTPSPNFGRLFAGLGDLEYFTRGVPNMETALNFYRMAERHGWAPPEMLFRMGVAYYNLESWGNALEYFFVASSELPLNHRVLFALGNSALKRGDFFAAQGFYNRLLNVLESQRARLPILLPNDRPEYLELAERLMMAHNNAGVASERLAAQTGDLSHRTRALALYSEAQRAWDARTRDPATMIRSGSVPLPQLNMRNALHPQPGFEPQIFVVIDRDALETSRWEWLAPPPQMTW